MTTSVRVYAGTQEGLFVWRSRKDAWENVAVSFETGTIDAIDGLRGRPNVVYLDVTQDGLYRTDDAGKSWRRVFEGNVRAVTVDPTDERVVNVGVEPIHLYRSEDDGESWEELVGVQALPAQVKANWTYPRPPHREHVRHIFVHPDDRKTLHVCLEHGGIIRSFDRGKTWQDVSGGIDYLDIHHISSAPGRKDLYFVASARGFFRTATRRRDGSGQRTDLPAIIAMILFFYRARRRRCWLPRQTSRLVIGTARSAPRARSSAAGILPGAGNVWA